MNGERSVNFLRWVATAIVAATFLVAGASKVWHPDAGVTMVGRYLRTPNAVRALGCMEIAMALWLLTGRNARLAPVTAAAALAGMALLIGAELQRNAPLPCGCLPMRPGVLDPFAARRGLWVSLGRNAFLIVLCGMSAALAPEEEPVS